MVRSGFCYTADMELYPLQFKLDGMTQSYLWGGTKLQPLVPDFDPGKPLAELWLVSDRPEDDRMSVVANGPLTGTSLHELVEQYGSALLGDAKLVDGKFPLLLKLLDAEKPLSLQVHPPAAVATELRGTPKTECWLFLEGTAPDATVTAGFNAPVTVDAVQKAITDNALESLVSTLDVNVGQALFIPSGRLHGIGAGCLLLEVQENSNTTYRVYDWQRIDPATNKPRELHLAQALRSITMDDVTPTIAPPRPISANGERLIDCPQFVLQRWQATGQPVDHTPDRSFEIIVPLTGSVELEAMGETRALQPLTATLLPACLSTYRIHGTGSYSRIFVPRAV